MFIYYTLYATIGLSAYIINKLKYEQKKKNAIFCVFWFILLILLFSLRHPSMGNDLRYGLSNGYLGQFRRISNLSFKELFVEQIQNYEIGFIIFNKIISYISTDYQYYLFICTFVTLLPITYVIFKYSESPVFSAIIFMGLPVFLMFFSGMRQIIAIGICTFSLKFIKEKKLIKFIIAVALATLFHYSAFVFSIAYPVYYIKFNRSTRMLSLLIIALIYIFRQVLFNFLALLFGEEVYIDNNGAITLFLIFVIIYIYCFIFLKDNKEYNGFLNIFLIACICQTFGGLNNLALRIGYFFMPSIALVLPNVVRKIEDKVMVTVSYIFIIFAFVGFGLWSLYNGAWAMSYPYHFFFA